MGRFDIAIIGGGAAGISSAIGARRQGASVTLCERMGRLGKKILASGNGRCNLLNDELNESYYNPAAEGLVRSVFSRFGKADILDFFKGLGLEVYSENGRVFPVTNQSSSVLKVLEMEIKRLSMGIELNFEAVDISGSGNGFIVKSKSGKTIECGDLIIACGGKTYPAFGSDGSAYRLARRFGHSIIEPVPSAVPIVITDSLCHLLQGQKIFADTKCIIDGAARGEASGDVLFTKYGLSGTSILDISEEVSIAINRRRSNDVVVSVDMVPFMSPVELKNELARRINVFIAGEDFLSGILPNKFNAALKNDLEKHDIGQMVNILKDRRFKITGTRGWNEAEFTSGGIDLKEVREGSLESRIKKGVYFAGEILDVEGKRGGYNLAWAWASGFVAGLVMISPL